MSEPHEINKLRLDLDGPIGDDLSDDLRDVVLQTIESSFDAFNDGEQNILIDKIELDLGEIKDIHLLQELKVRIAYLIREELSKILLEPSVKEQFVRNAERHDLAKFVSYLQKGFTESNESLSQLFEKLLAKQPRSLKKLFSQELLGRRVKSRLLSQIEFETWEKLWEQHESIKYREIRKINDQILKRFGATIQSGFDISGVQGLIKEITLEYMLAAHKITSEWRYTDYLKQEVERFAPFKSQLEGSVHSLLDALDTAVLKSEENSGLVQLKELKEYLEDMNVSINWPKAKTLFKQANLREVLDLVKQLKLHSDKKAFSQQLQRLFELLKPEHQKEVLVLLSRKRSGILSKKLGLLIELVELVKNVWKEDVWSLPSFLIVLHQFAQSSSDRSLISYVITVVASKSHHSEVEIADQLRHWQSKTAAKNKELEQDLKIISEQLEKESVLHERNDLQKYFIFLRYGRWLLHERSPAEVLEDLMSQKQKNLTSQLKRYEDVLSVWVRLIHQHPVELVSRLFEQVFEWDKDYQFFIGVTNEISYTQQPELLELFVASRIRAKETGQTFRNLLERELLQFEESSRILTELTLHERLVNLLSGSEPSASVHFDDLIHQIEVLFRIALSETIPVQKWSDWLLTFEKNQLVDLVRATDALKASKATILHEILLSDKEFLSSIPKDQLVSVALSTLEIVTQSSAQVLHSIVQGKRSVKQEFPDTLVDKYPILLGKEVYMDSLFDRLPATYMAKYDFVKELNEVRKTIGSADVRIWSSLINLLPAALPEVELKLAWIERLKHQGVETTQIGLIAEFLLKEVPESKLAHHVIMSFFKSDFLDVVPYFQSLDKFETTLSQLIKNETLQWTIFRKVKQQKVEEFLQQISAALIIQFAEQVGLGSSAADPKNVAERLVEMDGKASDTIVTELVDAPGVTQFADLLSRSVITGRPHFKPHFDDLIAFESYFRLLLELDTAFLERVISMETSMLEKFLQNLSSATLDILWTVVNQKWQSRPFKQVFEALEESNAAMAPKLRLHGIAYRLSKEYFDIDRYLGEVEASFPAITFSQEVQLMQSNVPVLDVEAYVQAFVHYLKFESFAHHSVESQKPVEILYKILLQWPAELVRQLKLTHEGVPVFTRLFGLVPPQKYPWLLQKLTSLPASSVADLLEQHKDPKEPDANFYAKWLTEYWRHDERLELYNLGTPGDRYDDEFEAELDQVIASLKQSEPLKEGSWETIGVREFYRDQWNVFDLLKEITRTGRVPIWSVFRNSSQLGKYLQNVIQVDLQRFKLFFKQIFLEMGAVENFIKVVGEKQFVDLYDQVEKAEKSRIDKLIEELSILYAEFKIPVDTKRYIKQKVITVKYVYPHLHTTAIGSMVSEMIASDFGYNLEVYRRAMAKAQPKLFEKYIVDSTKVVNSLEHQDPELTYFSDLFISLLEQGKPPWWHTKTIGGKKSGVGLLKKLVEEFLDKEQKQFYLILSKVSNQGRLPQLFQTLSDQEYNAVLAKLTPDFYGFIASLEILMKSWVTPVNIVAWREHTVKELLTKGSFELKRFIDSNINFLSKQTSKSLEQLKEELINEAKKRQEPRFEPIILMLDKHVAQKVKSEVPETVEIPDLTNAVLHYLYAGSIPVSNREGIRGEVDFSSRIRRLATSARGATFRVLVKKTLTKNEVRERLSKHPSRLLWVFIEVVLGRPISSLMERYRKLKSQWKVEWPEASMSQFDEHFFHLLLKEIASASKIGSDHELLNLVMKEMITLSKVDITKADKELWKQLGVDFSTSPKVETKTEKPVLEEETDLSNLFREQDELVDQFILVKTAGIVLFWPFLTRYFDMLGMLENNQFKTDDLAARAVQLLHYVATGMTDAPEHELILQKVLCGVPMGLPIPRDLDLSEKEQETSEQMIRGMLQNWERLKRTSTEALREGFLVREGFIMEHEEHWELKVEKKTLDILMENLPWSFGTIKLPWMEKILMVKWL